jgi:hypothetical protein
VLLVCLFHLLVAGGIYWHLVSGGWLSVHYEWRDPNNINLVLALLEGLVVALVIALLATRSRFVHRFLVDLFYIQLLLGTILLAVGLIFILTWHPKLF